MPDRIGLYHRLPYPLRCLAASARGYQLRKWRFGPETEILVERAGEREAWAPERWKVWQEEQLAHLLSRAATRVPYYCKLWTERRRRGDKRSWEQLENWPILGKDALRSDPAAFVADDRRTEAMFLVHTSGTTGTPLQLWRSRATDRQWYALFEARNLNWNGVSRRDRWAMLGGQLVAPVEDVGPPYWVRNLSMNQLYASSYHLGPNSVAAYLKALSRFHPEFMWGYASSMHALAQLALEAGLEAPSVSVAISNAEPLFDHQRKAIGSAFGCAVRNTYGMAEIVSAASECDQGVLHLWPEVGVTEIIDDAMDETVEPGKTGRLVCTGLLNGDMPLIRYEVGDRGALEEPSNRCACGRTLPSLRAIEGRSDDVLLTLDGRRIGGLNSVFKVEVPVKEAQIIQESLERIKVLVVPATGFGDKDAGEIVDSLRRRLGDVDVRVEAVGSIPRSAGGKFRAVINELTR